MASQEPPKGRGNASGCVAAGEQSNMVASLLAKAKARGGATTGKPPVPQKVVSKAIPDPAPPSKRVSGKSADACNSAGKKPAPAKKSSLPAPPQPKVSVPVPKQASKAAMPKASCPAAAQKTSPRKVPGPAAAATPIKAPASQSPKAIPAPADRVAGAGSPSGCMPTPASFESCPSTCQQEELSVMSTSSNLFRNG